MTYKDPNRRLYLFCVAEKYTSKPLTETAEVWANTPYVLVDLAHEKWGIRVDGKTNCIDWTDVTPQED